MIRRTFDPDRYLRILGWAHARYPRHDGPGFRFRSHPLRIARIERRAAFRYLHAPSARPYVAADPVNQRSPRAVRFGAA